MMMLTNDEMKKLQSQAADLMKDKLPKANIMAVGCTGAGKSTLLNAVFGEDLAKTGVGRPITDRIALYEKTNVPVRIWDTMGFEMSDKQVVDTVGEIKNVIAEKARSKNPLDRIHAIWYCTQSTGGKFQETESRFVKELSADGVPFIIVMTKCINKRQDNEFENSIKEILKEDGIGNIPIVRVLAKDWEFDENLILPSNGLDDLTNATLNNLADYVHVSFISAQRISKELKRGLAEGILLETCQVVNSSLIAKIPIANIFSTNDSMKKMFKDIGFLYNTELSEADIEMIYHSSIGKWTTKALYLMNPFGNFVFEKAEKFYDKYIKGEGGFRQTNVNISDCIWAAKLIIWAGYSWILSIEEHWDKLIEADAEERDKIVQEMIKDIREYMNEKNAKHPSKGRSLTRTGSKP